MKIVISCVQCKLPHIPKPGMHARPCDTCHEGFCASERELMEELEKDVKDMEEYDKEMTWLSGELDN